MSPLGSYKLTDKHTLKTLEDIFRIFDDYEYSIIGGLAVSIYSYLNKDIYYENRYTQDIDLVINEIYKENVKVEIYSKLRNAKIKEGKIFGHDGIKIEINNYPSISILFKDIDIPYNEIELKIGKKTIKLKVAKLEYLLVDKIFTYLDRREEKDLEDIREIVKIIKNKGYDKGLLEDVFNYYSSIHKKYEDTARNLLNNFLSSNYGRSISEEYIR